MSITKLGINLINDKELYDTLIDLHDTLIDLHKIIILDKNKFIMFLFYTSFNDYFTIVLMIILQ